MLVPRQSAITANASGTLGSGTWVQRVGTGSVMSSALNPWGFCGSSLTPLDCRYSRSVPVMVGVTAGGTGTAGATAAGAGAAGAAAGFGGANGFAAGGVASNLLGTCPGAATTFCGAGAGTAGAGGGAGSRGSADAVAPANAVTPIAPAARAPANTRNVRAT